MITKVKDIWTKLNKFGKIGVVVMLAGLVWLGYGLMNKQDDQVTYTTAEVTRGVWKETIEATGTITSGDTTYINTGATGVVKHVYVKNGDVLKKDQKIADLELDDVGQETQITAWNNYQEALVGVKQAKLTQQNLSVNVLQKKQALANAETAQRDAQSGGWNPTTKRPYTEGELAIVIMQYDEAKAAYDMAIKDSEITNVNISLAEAKVSAAYRNYQKVSGTIVSPAAGVLNNLTLATGVVIGDSSNASSITVSTGTDSMSNSVSVDSQRVGAVKNPNGQYQATVSLTEVDVTKVNSGQIVTLTLDAYSDKSLTGKVLAVNTSGSVNSGVTSYTATILIDKTELDLYTNMAVSVSIMIDSEVDVLMIPASAVTEAEVTSVQVLENGTPVTKEITIGKTNDSETIVTTGLSEGEKVITGMSKKSSTTSTSATGTNLFSGNRSGTSQMMIPGAGRGL